MKRRGFLTWAGAATLAPAVRAEERLAWRLITSWPKNSPGPGITAQRLADRIGALSGGRLIVKVYGAGELVPALEVFGAVARGVAELGHSAAFFWQGKIKASVFFTTAPFGLTADEQAAWIYHGGGQALWDELYAPFGLKPFMAGNTGANMGGWFKRELTSVDSLKGLKCRMLGLRGRNPTALRRRAGDAAAGRNFQRAPARRARRRRVSRTVERSGVRALQSSALIITGQASTSLTAAANAW